MIIEQVNRDKSIRSLFLKMDEVYKFLTGEEFQRIECMKIVVERITSQTLECSRFIRDYSENENFRKLRLHCTIAGGNLTCRSRDEIHQELGAWDGRPGERF